MSGKSYIASIVVGLVYLLLPPSGLETAFAREPGPVADHTLQYASAARGDSYLLPNRLLSTWPYPFPKGIVSSSDHCVQLKKGAAGGYVSEYYRCDFSHARLVLIDMHDNMEFAPAGIYFKAKENRVFNVGVGGRPLDQKLHR